jgi:phage pi2 protein 07
LENHITNEKGCESHFRNEMSKKNQINLEKYNEFAPKCTVCTHCERRLTLENSRWVYFCNANFNKGQLIFRETLDICDDENAFTKK